MAHSKHWNAGAWVGNGQGAESISPPTGKVLGRYTDATGEIDALGRMNAKIVLALLLAPALSPDAQLAI